MSVTPKCPYCGSTEKPTSVAQEHNLTTVLVLYCASCGSILAAADFSPHPDLTGGQSQRGEARDE
jgi:uncharacterized Zn finger protein